MIRAINGACFNGGVAHIRVITNRAEAQDHESYFFQLVHLYQQLTDRTPAKYLMQLPGPNLHFIFLTDQSNLIGSATFAVVRTAIRCKGLIEDLVVDQNYRSAGLGKVLVEESVRIGRLKGCQCLQLTSKPDRPGTACFYSKLGFDTLAFAREKHPEGTNLYRYTY